MIGIREYAAEFLGTALLLLVGLSAVVRFRRTLAHRVVRTRLQPAALLTALIVAGTLTAIVSSPLGRRSGGSPQPGRTLAFLRLGKST